MANNNFDSGFLPLQVKCKTAHTLEYLSSLSPTKQARLVNFSIVRTSQLSTQRAANKEAVTTEILAWIESEHLAKDKKKMQQMENRVSELANRGNIQIEELMNLTETEVSEATKLLLSQLFKDPNQAVGTEFLHNWLDDATQATIVYHGRISKKKRRRVVTFDVTYHLPSADPNECHDEILTRDSLVADARLGDLKCIN
jgi:hypothetical protein